MIHTIRTVAVGDQESKIDSPIILYRGDREVEVEFTINGSKFTFTNGGNVIKSTNATHGQLVINTPTGENMFSEVTECHNGKVVFVITKEMIDELIEVGFYSFQIRLFDESQVSRVTIPPVLKGIDIRNPIAAEDETNVVDIGLVDYAVVVKDEFEDLSTFLPDGNYNKTEWESKDVISGAKLNKIEDALYNINSNMEATDLALFNRIENINRDVRSEFTELSYNIKNEVEEFESEVNNGAERFKIDIENTITSTLETIKDNNAILNVKDFGAIGNGIDDDRSVIEEAINHLKYTGGILRFPSGRYLLNSYSDDVYLTELWGQILPLYSNITISLDPGAEIILGDFFVDKKFILFNGYNEKEYNFKDCSNVKIIGGSIDFGGIGMISTITKRVGIAVGNGSNLSIENITFKNGDLRNCIIAGDKTNNEYLFVNNCRFIDLVQDGVNNDFTAIYANMRRSKITNCDFINTSRKGWEIGCCVELHQSDSVWSNSSVYKYARGCFLASSPTEGGQVERLNVHGINGVLNTELANFWCDDGCVLQIIKIHDNNIVSMTRDDTMTNTLYYGVSCITSTSCKPNSAITGLTRFVDVHDNTLIVPTDNRGSDLSAMFTINNNATHIEDVSYYNNRCSVMNLCYTKGCETSQLKSFKIYDNTFEVSTMRSDVFGLFTFKSLLNCYIKINIAEPLINQMTYLLRFLTTDSGSGNTVIIEPQNTEKITKPFMYDDIFIETCKFEYPSNSTFIVTSATGVNSMYATADNQYITSARMISNDLPSTVFTCGSFIKNGSVLRTIVSISSDSTGNYPIRLLNSNLK